MPSPFAPKDNARVFTATSSSIHLDFLGPGRLAAKTLIHGYWISLDFLGFSRPKSRLINGLHGKNHQKFFCAASSSTRGKGRPTGEIMRMRRIVHEQRLTCFLIFLNRVLSRGPSSSALIQSPVYCRRSPIGCHGVTRSGLRSKTAR